MNYLETPRIFLREVEPQDVSIFLDIDSDPDVMEFLTDGRPSTLDEVNSAMERVLNLKSRHQGKFGLFIAIEKSSNEPIGWFLFRPCKKDPDNLESVELGYRLKKKYWGKGYAPEVSRSLIKKGFEEFKLKEVWAKTMAKNLKSRRVMEKVGLIYDCDFIEEEFPGSDKNAVRYSLKS